MLLARGDTFGRYVIDAVLGAGGGGEVYRAEDTVLKRAVALKVLLPNAVDIEQGAVRARILREARAAAQLNHPHVAAIFDVGEQDGLPYMAMELVPGRSLRAYVGARDVPMERRLRWLSDVALALDAAHEAGLVHRDVKPENVIVRDDGFIKVVDFGIARQTTIDPRGPTIKDTGATSAGTPHYMAPEQIRTETLDGRADQFGWGVTAYELLSGGELPWDSSGGALKYVASILGEDPVPLRVRAAEVPAEVAVVIERALRRSREERFASMAEIVRALDPLRSHSGPDVVRISVLPPPSSDLGHRVTTKAPVSGRDAREVGTRFPEPSGRALVSTRARRTVALALIAATGLAGGLGYLARRASSERMRASATASANALSTRAVTLVDLPLPASTVPEAVTEYKAGLQLLRDDSFSSAARHFRRAANLDPTMAQAYLRIAKAGWGADEDPGEARAALMRALAMRAQLDERDRALLDAMEPVIGRTEPDEAEAIERLEAAQARFPLDEELLVTLAELVIGDAARSSALARRASELDPSDAYAWEELGRSLALSGDLDGSRRSLERCASVSVESADCYFWLAGLDRGEGRCAEMESTTRRLVDIDPDGNALLAQAQVEVGRSENVVRDTLARWVATKSPDQRAHWQAVCDARLDVLGGRFDAATKHLSDVAERLAASPEGRSSVVNKVVEALRVRLLAEAGNATAARAVARELSEVLDLPGLARRRSGIGRYLWAIRAASLPLDPRRREWVDRQLRSSAPGSGVWVLGWALPAVTAEDASEALAALKADARLALPRGGEAMIPLREGADGPAGHVLLLAGKPAEALPFLRRAAASCFAYDEPFEHIHAQLDLGRALEALGDRRGACAAFESVLDRWGNAEPRSVTADEARKSARGLRCKPGAVDP